MKLKLNQERRRKLAVFATTKFTDEKLRAVEAAAEQAIRDTFAAVVDAIPAEEMAALAKHGLTRTAESINVFGTWNRRVMKEFERPDGVEVKRESLEGVMLLAEPERLGINWNEMRVFAGRTEPATAGHHWELVDLKRTFTVPQMPSSARRSFLAVDNSAQTQHDLPTVLREALPPLTVAWLEAKRERQLSETRLMQAIIRVIDAADHFEQLVEVWPEAAEIKDDLFPPPAANPVLILNDADKALLCDAMSARGVESRLCAA